MLDCCFTSVCDRCTRGLVAAPWLRRHVVAWLLASSGAIVDAALTTQDDAIAAAKDLVDSNVGHNVGLHWYTGSSSRAGRVWCAIVCLSSAT